MAQERGRSTEKEEDLRAREYRDSQGNVHHHTKKYMEAHRGERDDDEESNEE